MVAGSCSEVHKRTWILPGPGDPAADAYHNHPLAAMAQTKV